MGGFYGLVTHLDGSVVPLDEPRVAAAKADHLATKDGTVAAALPAVPAVPAVHAAVAAAVPAVPAVHAVAAAPVVQHAVQYAGPIHVPSLVAHPNGAVVPVDEPAVAAARAEHLQAHGVAVPAAAYAYAPTGYVDTPPGTLGTLATMVAWLPIPTVLWCLWTSLPWLLPELSISLQRQLLDTEATSK